MPVGEGHIVTGGGSLLCQADRQPILEGIQSRYDAKHNEIMQRLQKGEDQPDRIIVYSQTFTSPKTSRMCEDCKKIFRSMTDWTRWENAVEDYSNIKSNGEKDVKPKRKKHSARNTRATAKGGGTNNKKNAAKAKKRVPTNRKGQ